MAVLTGRFPDDIAKGAEGGPGWDVTFVQHAGGHETTHLNDPHPTWRWNVARAVEKLAKHEVARRHYFLSRSGYHQFRFKDHTDYLCPRTGSDKGRLVGASTAWTINKVYGAGASQEYVRRLYRIVAATESIWRNGTLQVRNTHYTINNDTGAVTAATSWTGDTLEVACQFDVLCRYDTARLSARVLARGADSLLRIHWADIDIVSVVEADA
jgi:uncharacterized protein (TIGR02217 family)